MSKQFFLTFNVKDDDTIDCESMKIKQVPPRYRAPDTPPGQTFVVSLLLILFGILFIVNFWIPRSQQNTNQQEPAPSNSEDNPTAISPINSESL